MPFLICFFNLFLKKQKHEKRVVVAAGNYSGICDLSLPLPRGKFVSGRFVLLLYAPVFLPWKGNGDTEMCW